MAAGFIARPGTKGGPCDGCSHRDCVNTRMTADSLCGICFQPIGYERRFYNIDGQLVHADEYEDKVENERKEQAAHA